MTADSEQIVDTGVDSTTVPTATSAPPRKVRKQGSDTPSRSQDEQAQESPTRERLTPAQFDTDGWDGLPAQMHS